MAATTARSRAANVSAVIRKHAGLTPRPSGSTTNTGTIVRAGLEWPTICISDPYDRPSNTASGEREVRDRTAAVVRALEASQYTVDWTVTDLGGVHGWFGHVTVTGRRPKLTKTEQARQIATRAAEFCRKARLEGCSNTIGELELQETAQVLDLRDVDGWTIRRAAQLVRAECTSRGESDFLTDEIYMMTSHK